MRSLSLTFCLLLGMAAQAQLNDFNPGIQPDAPDYSKEKNWAALPFRKDAADAIPKGEQWINDSLKQVDVFYIYPTIYRKGKSWTADLGNKKLNKQIDNKPVRYQASVFNQSCRVYAPRYRQAILASFYDKTGNGDKALDYAYEDVKAAFKYYLEHYNNGRPVIIASHSQGTRHSRRLLAEFFDNTPLSKQLVAAYIIGYAINDTMYKVLQPCNNETGTGCYITWASFKKGYDAGNTGLAGNVCINPITWSRDTAMALAGSSQGSMLLSFNKKYEHACGAQIHNNVLWVDNRLPLIRGWNVLHIADYNLFWYDIRANVKKRVQAYLKK